jgi:ABC-2 type transport system ATP-binding protein
MLTLTDLSKKENALTKTLSGGQRQRLALAVALLNKPQILFLDEPTTGLDPHSRLDMWNILKNLKEQGNTTLILTTHYMEEAETLCDHIIIIDEGKILREGNLSELLDEKSCNLDELFINTKVN